MKIRKAVENDQPALRSLINKAYRVTDFFKYEDRVNEEEMNNYFSAGAFLLMEDSDEIIACIYYRLTGTDLNFSLLSVDPGKQEKGYGKMLIKKVEEIAVDHKCVQLIIYVVNLREPLFPFYKKLGFIPAGTRPFPKPTKLPCHLVIMTKRCSG